MVTVVATKDFAYHGQAISAGQDVEMEAIDAAVHARTGDVSLDKGARPTYQTRDMQATPAGSGAPTPIPIDTQKPARRRRTRKKLA